MLVCIEFTNDNYEALKDLQYEMYSYSISTIFTTAQNIYTNNTFSRLYITDDKAETYKSISNYDHRLLQNAHDTLAAVFRYKASEGKFENELFRTDNAEIQKQFASYYCDTNFLNKIPSDNWHYAIKWHDFLYETIKSNISFIKEIVNATLINSGIPNDDAWEAASKASSIIKEKYKEIPWIKTG